MKTSWESLPVRRQVKFYGLAEHPNCEKKMRRCLMTWFDHIALSLIRGAWGLLLLSFTPQEDYLM